MQAHTEPRKTQPTITEIMSGRWQHMPALLRSLFLAIALALVVLIPANTLIRSRIYALTTDNLRAMHQEQLSEVSAALESFLGAGSIYLSALASRDDVQACASTECTGQDAPLFVSELRARLRDRALILNEIGFLNAAGVETARAIRGSGGVVLSGQADSAAPMYRASDSVLVTLRTLRPGQAFISPIGLDVRIPAGESYQQPVVRFVMPVYLGNAPTGYVTAVVSLDDVFSQYFAPDEKIRLSLLNADRCLLASSDPTRRSDLYKTWGGAADKVCLVDLPIADWDVSVSVYQDQVISTRVLRGILALSDQTWTILIEQPRSIAYAQAAELDTFMTLVHIGVVLLIAGLIVWADRAQKRVLVPVVPTPKG